MWEKIKTAILGIIGYALLLACIGGLIYMAWFHTAWVLKFVAGKI
jgi:hypothetical protein